MITLKKQNQRGLVTKRYNFHGIFRLAVHSDDPQAIREFQAEYSAFEDPAAQPVDLEVTISPFSIAPAADTRHFGRYKLAGDWIYGAERYKVASWQFAMRGLDEPITQLFFHGGMFSLFFLQHFFVEQIMRYKICQKGFVLVHGGCVAENGVSVLFPAMGQVGKTALALLQTLAGRRFQSDDYTFVSATGQTYSYPRRLHISDHIHDACPAVTRSLSLKHKLSIKIKMLIYYLTLTYGDLSESLQLTEMLPDAQVQDVARLGTILLLNSAAGTQLEGPLPIAKEDLISRVMAINCLEGKPFYNIFLGYQYGGHKVSLPEWWNQEREILRRALAHASSYEVVVPRHAPSRTTVLEETKQIMDRFLKENNDGFATQSASYTLQSLPK